MLDIWLRQKDVHHQVEITFTTRFRHGLPFHAGTGWRVMETGLRAGARLLAH